MPRILEFQAYEDRTHPRERWPFKHGLMYRRRYNIPRESLDIIPAKGARVVLNDIDAADLAILGPRVYSDPIIEAKDQAAWQVTITFYQLEQYA